MFLVGLILGFIIFMGFYLTVKLKSRTQVVSAFQTLRDAVVTEILSIKQTFCK